MIHPSHIASGTTFPGRAPNTGHILVLAYACGPGRGSEESVGWDTAAALAEVGFRVTVLTRTSERNTCPSLSDRPQTLDIVCHDNPPALQHRFDRMGKPGVELGYLKWLFSARSVVQDLHRQRQFTSAQHVTYARYWMPSPLRALDIPWILGPVGGGESIPGSLRPTLSRSGLLFEALRDVMRATGERSSSVKHAASECHVALANTRETAERLKLLGAPRVEIMNSAALADEEFLRLAGSADRVPSSRRSGFISIGRLLDWKGFHLGMQAFAKSALKSESYTILGSGPFEGRLRALAGELGIADRVQFTGAIPRTEVFNLLGSARALIHPSLHESGGFVCLEAMASGTPVICVDTGGPGLFVTADSGYPVEAQSPSASIESLADAMRLTVLDLDDYEKRRQIGIEHVRQNHTMATKVARLVQWHRSFASVVNPELEVITATSFGGRSAIAPDSKTSGSKTPDSKTSGSKTSGSKTSGSKTSKTRFDSFRPARNGIARSTNRGSAEGVS